MPDHGFHPVRVARVVEETAEASTFVLDVPDGFGYQAGQFVTFRVEVDGEPHLRCYSMSSTPDVDDACAVTVKRVPGGAVSNWLLDHVHEGDTVDVTVPAGVFCLAPGAARPLVLFAAGSGITPIFSLLKAAGGSRAARLLYANRDEASTIFRAALAPFDVRHHLDVESGFVDAGVVRSFLGDDVDVDAYVCGPTPFMDVVESALLDAGVAAERIHIERFVPGGPAASAVARAPAAEDDGPAEVTITIDGKTASAPHHPGSTLLQMARQLGLNPPYSCESGSCATCMARLTDGECSMYVNNALTDDELDEGWVLTCQAVPVSSSVRVVYEGA